jgi:cystathionine beta-lyase
MAALSAMLRTLRPGERVLAGRDLYGGTLRLLERVLPGAGVVVDRVDPARLELVRAALRPSTKLVLIETPTNPRLEVADIAALARLAHERGAALAVDNSLLSPYLQRPLELGADLVVHTATKHLAGHGDVMAGALVCADETWAERIAFAQNAEGAGLAPFDSWLVLRGLKTLAVRLDRAQQTAAALVERLVEHPAVRCVHWPGLAGHPGAALHARQASGPGSVFSFATGDPERSRRIVEGTRLFRIAVSFGSTSSRISLPACMSHAGVAQGPGADLVRVSVGLEAAADLLDDLGQALERSAGARCLSGIP